MKSPKPHQNFRLSLDLWQIQAHLGNRVYVPQAAHRTRPSSSSTASPGRLSIRTVYDCTIDACSCTPRDPALSIRERTRCKPS